MEEALAEYSRILESGAELHEADWSKERGLEFREALEKRDELVRELEFFAVEGEDFVESVSPPNFYFAQSRQGLIASQYKVVHGERILEDKIAGSALLLLSF